MCCSPAKHHRRIGTDGLWQAAVKISREDFAVCYARSGGAGHSIKTPLASQHGTRMNACVGYVRLVILFRRLRGQIALQLLAGEDSGLQKILAVTAGLRREQHWAPLAPTTTETTRTAGGSSRRQEQKSMSPFRRSTQKITTTCQFTGATRRRADHQSAESFCGRTRDL